MDGAYLGTYIHTILIHFIVFLLSMLCRLDVPLLRADKGDLLTGIG